MSDLHHVTLTNRWAKLDDYYSDAMNDFFSYVAPGYYFSPAYKRRVWDGKIRMIRFNKIPAGVFIRLYKDAEQKLGISFEVNDKRVRPKFQDVGIESDRDYQNECVKAMEKASRTGGIVLNSTGCLAKGTYIDVPRDLVKHPKGIRIEKLVGTQPWVYCYDKKRRCMSLAQASSVHLSGKKQPVYRVTFEPIVTKVFGRERKVPSLSHIDVTANHEFLMRDLTLGAITGRKVAASGLYVSADRLKPGDRLMPFFRQFAVDTYAKINLNNGNFVYEHTFILEKLKGARSDDYEGHHRNRLPLDNTPHNLKWFRGDKHKSYHAKRNRALGKFIGWETTGVHPRGMSGKTQSIHQRSLAKMNKAEKHKRRLRHGLTKGALLRGFCEEGLSVLDLAKRHRVTDVTIRYWLKKYGIPQESNHVVKSVEFLGYRDVYDITVPKYHNFVANGVVVHNSGKTRIAGLYFGRLNGYGVFVVDELTLLEQTREELSSVLHEHVGKIGDQEFKPERITVATIQTLHKHVKDPQFDKWWKKLDVAIVDELHLALNKRNLATLSSIPFKAIFGLTATLKMSQKPIRMKAWALCGPVIFEYPLKQGVLEERLAPGIVIGSDMVKVETPEERKLKYVDAYTQMVVYGKRWNRRIVKLTVEATHRGYPAIVLVQRVTHVKRLYRVLHALGVRVKAVFGEKTTEQRRRYIQKLEKGELDVLIVNKVFQKGISIDCVSAMVDGTAAKDPDSALQKYGRGVRLHKQKTGLLYFHLGYIGTRFQNAGRVHRKAYKKAGLEVKVPTWKGANRTFDYAEMELKKVLYRLDRKRRKERKKKHDS